jgi:hypothetical protein
VCSVKELRRIGGRSGHLDGMSFDYGMGDGTSLGQASHVLINPEACKTQVKVKNIPFRYAFDVLFWCGKVV